MAADSTQHPGQNLRGGHDAAQEVSSGGPSEIAAPGANGCVGLSFGSLFSGIGGLDLGLERAGMTCRWQVEIDPFCRQVLAKHWPDVPKYGDIRKIDFTQLEPVDLLCGGFPCQPFSLAGARKGEKDERYLWPEFARAISDVGPRIVLLENVPGLLSIDSGRVFGRVLADLASLGFDAEWDCIPAAAVGAPHLRYRVFIVAYAASSRCCAGQLEQGGETRDFAWRQELERLGGEMANSFSAGRSVPQGSAESTQRHGRRAVSGSGPTVADAHGKQALGPPVPWQECDPWPPEPGVGRLAYGLPARLAAPALRGLGNAVVPPVAEWIGRRIVEAQT